MKIQKCIMFSLVVAALGTTVSVASADEEHEEGHKHEAISMEKLPQVVKDGLTKEAKGAKLENIRSETEDGKVYYEADVAQGSKRSEVRVDSNGKPSPEDDDGDERS